MSHFSITENLEEALQQARRSKRDDLGYLYHTFRIRLSDDKPGWPAVLSNLVDAGWQLQGSPVVMEAADATPRHVLISMLHAEPRPMEIHGMMRFRGEFNGEAELHGHPRI
jgi:hypothetical protein